MKVRVWFVLTVPTLLFIPFILYPMFISILGDFGFIPLLITMAICYMLVIHILQEDEHHEQKNL